MLSYVSADEEHSIDRILAARLQALRRESGWSLDELARRSGVSRATLSRLENAEVSATASVLNRLCAAYSLTMSRLMRMVEGEGRPVLPRREQEVWTDAATGFRRRGVSPPGAGFAGEVIEGELPPGALIEYETSPRPGLEHHLLVLEGRLAVTIDGRRHDLGVGDCLRYCLFGPSRFETGSGARYLLFMI
jgi:transcriptional regulator with XRE-family HTH domain